MPVPIVYRKSVESAVASYDATDILNGTGIISFYAGIASTNKLLSSTRFYSGTGYTTSGVITSGAVEKYLDLDFDVLINKPITLKGTCIASVPVQIFKLNITGETNARVDVYVRKWDGSTETFVASGSSAVLTISAQNYSYKMASASMNIPTTSLKKGEYLRVTTEGWGGSTDSNNTITLGHDPMGVLDSVWTSTTVAPTSVIQLPFRIDL